MKTLRDLSNRAAVCIGMASCLIALAPALRAAPVRGWAETAALNVVKNRTTTDPLRVADRLQIDELFARWGIAYDEARLDLVPDLFTSNAQFRVVLGNDKPVDTASGRQDIAQKVGNSLRQQGDQRRHLISNIVITPISAREASANAYGIVAVAGDAITLGTTVFYQGHLLKGGDGLWRFSSFTVGMDQYVGKLPNTDASDPPAGTK